MNKVELAARLAKQTRLFKAEAADQLDRIIHQIISKLRKGKPARFPGLGNFQPDDKWRFRFEAEMRNGGRRAAK